MNVEDTDIHNDYVTGGSALVQLSGAVYDVKRGRPGG